MSRKKYDETFKRQIIHEYETGGISCYALGQKYGVDAKCVRSWCRLYKQFGEDYFTANHANLNYSAEFKQQVVDSYPEKHINLLLLSSGFLLQLLSGSG